MLFSSVSLPAVDSFTTTNNVEGYHRQARKVTRTKQVFTTNILSRYFGQTLGAALFGSLFNHFMREQLQHAPDALRPQLPGVNGVLDTLQSGTVTPSVNNYLREAFYQSTNWVYVSLLACATCCMLALLQMPARFRSMEEESQPERGEPGKWCCRRDAREKIGTR